MPKNDFTKMLIMHVVEQMNSLCTTIAKLKAEMSKIAKTMPEYETVISMHGVGKSLAPQLIAEIGDIRRYPKRSSLARYAGIEPPENQSGAYNQYSRRISKQGSLQLRKALFQVMRCVLQLGNPNEDVYQFISRKRSEGIAIPFDIDTLLRRKRLEPWRFSPRRLSSQTWNCYRPSAYRLLGTPWFFMVCLIICIYPSIHSFSHIYRPVIWPVASSFEPCIV